jgi:hypothetical protein
MVYLVYAICPGFLFFLYTLKLCQASCQCQFSVASVEIDETTTIEETSVKLSFPDWQLATIPGNSPRFP